MIPLKFVTMSNTKQRQHLTCEDEELPPGEGD